MEQKSTKAKGIYSYRKKYLVDSQYKGERIRKRGFTSLREAEQYLIFEKQGIDRLNTEGFRPKIILEMAALRYLEEKAEKTSLETDIYLLKEMIKICSTLPINEINNETLKVFVNSRKRQGIKNKTINSALAVVRHICNLASSSWRLPNGMTWLEHRPVITLLDLNDQRPPRPISWTEQERLLEALPFHLK